MTTVHHAAQQGFAPAGTYAQGRPDYPPGIEGWITGALLTIDTHPALRGRASVGFPYQTQAYACQRVD